MINRLKNNPAGLFVIKLLILFAAFYYFFLFYEGITAPGNLYSPFLDEHLNFVQWFREFLLRSSAAVLNLSGYETIRSEYVLRVVGRSGIRLVYSCLGFGVMSFFTAFVLAYPVKLKRKLVFLLCGLTGIQLLNIGRFCLLSLHWSSSCLKGKIDHHTIFNIIIYLAIFITLHFWVKANRSPLNERNAAQESI